MQSRSETPIRWEIKALFQAAMVIFVITVGIGILNGLKVVKFARPDLLMHVHAGTIGWITLGVLALCLWLFDGSEGRGAKSTWLTVHTLLAIIATPLYVLAFWYNEPTLRAWLSVPVFIAIAGFFVWIIAQARRIPLGIAQLAILGAILNLTVGAILGALLQFQVALKQTLVPQGTGIAHPTTMVIGYLILVGMALSEWYFKPRAAGWSKLALVQIGAPFVGGVLLTLGALLDIQALIFSNVLFEFIGVVIYLIRFAPIVARTRWLARAPDRLFALSAIFVVVNIALFSYLIVQYVTGAYGTPPKFELIPYWLIFGMDHAMFIGVMTNALFGAMLVAAAARQQVWGWADDVLFWGMNFGMIGFVTSLLLNAPEFEKIFTPIMGASILLAIAVYSVRLQRTMNQ